MRRMLLGALVLGGITGLPLLAACSGDDAEANPSARAEEAPPPSTSTEDIPAGLALAEFDVAGMDCGGCVIATRTALHRLDGIEQADASYDDDTGEGAAWAVYDPEKVTPERMMEAILELGYTPALVEG